MVDCLVFCKVVFNSIMTKSPSTCVQMANRSQVQKLYGWYYWSWKTASVTSFTAAYLLSRNDDIKVVMNAVAGMVLVCIIISLGFLLTGRRTDVM